MALIGVGAAPRDWSWSNRDPGAAAAAAAAWVIQKNPRGSSKSAIM